MKGARAASPDFAISQFTFWNQTFEEDLALLKRQGITAMELCERKLSEDPQIRRQQLDSLRDSGIRVTSIQPRVHALFPDSMCPDLHSVEARVNQYRKTIELMAEYFPGTPLLAISGNAPGFNYSDAHRTARVTYEALAKHAEAHGMLIAFEPLNPILMNNDTFISSLTEAVQLIEQVGHERFVLALDIWHVWREPGVLNRIANLSVPIGAVHISDWPAAEPRCPGDRLLLSDGVIDLPGMLSAVSATGYDGSYCLEIFSENHLPDSIWRRDPDEVCRLSRSAFEAAWQAGGRL